MIIRPATPDDIAQMRALERAAATAAHWGDAQYETLLETRFARVAEEGGRVLGFLVARTIGPDWELENIVTAADARGRGVGTALVEHLLRSARGAAERVVLEVRESNHYAHALYARCGFRCIGERKDYYNDPAEDAVLYAVEIQRATA